MIQDRIPYVFYGNNLLRNSRYACGSHPRSSSSFNYFETQKEQGFGSIISRQKQKSRDIELDLEITTGNIDAITLQNSVVKLKNIFTQPETMLRVAPKSAVLEVLAFNAGQSIAGWSLTNDAENLSLATDDYELLSASLKFDIDASNSIESQSIVRNETLPGFNATSWLGSTASPCHNVMVFLPSNDFKWVQFYVGQSSANSFRSKKIYSNYEGKPLKYGNNLISVPHSDLTVFGSPTLTNFCQYFALFYGYESTMVDTTGVRFDGYMIVLDDYLRNYQCVLTDNFELDEDFKKLAVIGGQVKLNNYTGYSQATHFYQAYSSPSALNTKNTQKIEFKSSLEPLVELNIGVVDTEGLTSFSIKNNNQLLTIPSTYANGDIVSVLNDPAEVKINQNSANFSGQIPTWTPGINLTEVSFTSNTTTTIDTITGENPPNTGYYYAQVGKNQVGYRTVNNAYKIAQSFVLASAKDVESFEFWLKFGSAFASNNSLAKVSIYTDNAGEPGTETQIITEGLSISQAEGLKKVFLPVNFNLASGTYWLVIENTSAGSETNYFEIVGNKTDTFAGGQAKILRGVSWQSITGYASEATIRPIFDIQLIVKLKQSTQSQYSWELLAKNRYV